MARWRRKYASDHSADSEVSEDDKKNKRSKKSRQFFNRTLLVLLLLAALLGIALVVWGKRSSEAKNPTMVCQAEEEDGKRQSSQRNFQCEAPGGYQFFTGGNMAKIPLQKKLAAKSSSWLAIVGTASLTPLLLVTLWFRYGKQRSKGKKAKKDKKTIRKKHSKNKLQSYDDWQFKRPKNYRDDYPAYDSDSSITDDYFSDYSESTVSDFRHYSY